MEKLFKDVFICFSIVLIIGVPYTMYVSLKEYEKGFNRGVEMGKLESKIECVYKEMKTISEKYNEKPNS